MGCPFCGRWSSISRGSPSEPCCWVQASPTASPSGVYVSTGALCMETAVYVTDCGCRAREVFRSGDTFGTCPECYAWVRWRLLHSLLGGAASTVQGGAEASAGVLLLVESVDAIARAVERVLSSERLEIVRARGCADACYLASRRPFSMAVINFRLPDGGGVELGERMLRLGRIESVVFLAGVGSTIDERVRAIGLGVVVTSESAPDVLLDAVTSAPASQRLRGPAAS